MNYSQMFKMQYIFALLGTPSSGIAAKTEFSFFICKGSLSTCYCSIHPNFWGFVRSKLVFTFGKQKMRTNSVNNKYGIHFEPLQDARVLVSRTGDANLLLMPTDKQNIKHFFFLCFQAPSFHDHCKKGSARVACLPRRPPTGRNRQLKEYPSAPWISQTALKNM